MSLTEEAKSSLNAKIEPRPAGVMTETGLQKLADGTLIARHATEDGSRTPEQMFQALDNDSQRMAELEALREQAEDEKPKRKSRRKAAESPIAVPPPPQLRQITITIPGFGGIPSQYTHVYIGNGIAVLGLSTMSFTPQGPDKNGQPSTMLELSSNPGVKYVYLGNTFVDKFNIKNLLLVEVPEGDK
jgi:hypothetical protein